MISISKNLFDICSLLQSLGQNSVMQKGNQMIVSENTNLAQKYANQHSELKEVKDELDETRNKLEKFKEILNEKNNELEKTKESKEVFEKFVQSELLDAKNGLT